MTSKRIAQGSGGTTTVSHVKTASTPDLMADCGHCGEDVDITLEFEVYPGVPFSTTTTVMCAF